MPKPHATPASPNSAAIPCVLSNILAEVLQVLAHGHHELISVWEADYFPFGSERQVFTNIASNSYQFTGYEYDSDTQYNYAIARFEAGRWGQFLTPNPYLGSGNIGNPQSLNRYSYVLNDPLKFIDPLGLDNDCGGPCTDFTAGTFGDCALNVSYHKETGEDGKLYDIPDFFITCPTPQASRPLTGGRTSGRKKPNNKQCTLQRVVSGVRGALNLGLATIKTVALIPAVGGLGATGVGAPAAGALGVYGVVSNFGQGLAGASQLFSAFTGNYGASYRVEQLGNIR